MIMVSGFFGTKKDYREVMSLLAEAGDRGWAYDYSGQLELATAGEVDYTIKDMAGDLTELIRTVTGGRPAHLIGHCLGGFVARSAAVCEPGLARSLTLLACGPDMRDEKHQSMLEGLAKLHANGGTIALAAVKALLAKNDTVMREFWHAKLSEMNRTGSPASRSRWRTNRTAATSSSRPAFLRGGVRQAGPPGVDPRHVRRDGLPPAGRSCDHPKASHSPNMEQPAILAEALLEFYAAEGAYEGEPAAMAG